MPKMVQIRHVPDDVHRTLKVRAAKEGMSLSDYLNREVARLAAMPTMEEWLEHVVSLPRQHTLSTEEIVQLIRDDRDAH